LTGGVERSLAHFNPDHEAVRKLFAATTDNEVPDMPKRSISNNYEKTGQLPPMSDWRGERLDDGFRAHRLTGLSDYQTLNGCLNEVRAQDEGELWLLCDAQTRLSERIALAESTRRRP
jgi:hypothetical protein